MLRYTLISASAILLSACASNEPKSANVRVGDSKPTIVHTGKSVDLSSVAVLNQPSPQHQYQETRSIRSIFTGNTSLMSSGNNPKKFYVYFKDDGKLFAYRNNYSKLVGKWYISNNDRLCLTVPDGRSSTPDTICYDLTRDQNNNVYGWYRGKRQIRMTAMYQGDGLNMVAMHNNRYSQESFDDLRAGLTLLGTFALGVIAIDAVGGYGAPTGGQTTQPYRLEDRPDLIMGR
jgi:hypothetical protein